MADEHLMRICNQPYHPTSNAMMEAGITRFDYFYAMAMQGMLAKNYIPIESKGGRELLLALVDDATNYAINAIQEVDCAISQLG